MSTLTGADLYRAFNAGDCDAVPWGSVSRDIQDLHTCTAAIVQQTHIQPLQQRIEALEAFVQDVRTVLAMATMPTWPTIDLHRRAQELLGEEVK